MASWVDLPVERDPLGSGWEVTAADENAGRDGVTRRRAFDPSQVPEGVWDDRAVQEALVRRDIGRFLERYSEHTGARQGDLARCIGRTQPEVWRIIRTERQVLTFDLLTEIADGLGLPDRARLLMGLAPAGMRVGPELKLDRIEREQPAARSTGRSPYLPEIIDGLSGALFAFGAKTSMDRDAALDVTQLETRVAEAWHLRQRAQYAALGTLLTGLLGDAEASTMSSEGDDQATALRLLVHAYNAASSLLKKLGDFGLALLAADRAVQAARSVGEPLLVAAAAHRLANVLLPAQRLDETRAIALRAADAIEPAKLATPRSYAMWGGLLLTAAVAAARHGDESQAWELMGEARTASRLLGLDHADLYSIFGPTNVAVHGVQVAVELHNGRDAVRRAACVDVDRLPNSLVERRAQFLVDVATGHALERDDAGAVAALLRAEQIAPEEVRYSQSVQATVGSMLARERVGAATGLRELAVRLGVG